MHISKMKINYLKSNFVFLADDSQRAEMLFNCNNGHSPITCLGVPLSTRRLLLVEWKFLMHSVDILYRCSSFARKEACFTGYRLPVRLISL
jgi:hypothetical protein